MGRIILEGFMGSGKSTYGKILSKEFLLDFCDTDAEIERIEGCSISGLFEKKGEEYFRERETLYLKEILEKNSFKNGVISVGGGMPVREENRKLMRECGIVVYLKASPEVLKDRLKSSRGKRPMLKDTDLDERVDALLKAREGFYNEAAHHVILTDGMEIYEVVNKLKMIYNKGGR